MGEDAREGFRSRIKKLEREIIWPFAVELLRAELEKPTDLKLKATAGSHGGVESTCDPGQIGCLPVELLLNHLHA